MKKAIATFLLSAMLVSMTACAGCTDKKNSGNESPVSQNTSDVTEVVEELSDSEKYLRSLNEKLDGATVNFLYGLQSEDPQGTNEITYDFEELDGDVLKDAVYARTTKVEELLDCSIKSESLALTEAAGIVGKNVTANDSSYDVISVGKSQCNALAVKDYLYNMKDISTLDLSNNWWDQTVNEYYHFNNRQQYIAAGDILYNDNYYIGCIFYNKDIGEKYHLESPYTLMDEGSWTIDKMAELTANVYDDFNGNGMIDKEDQFGFWSNCGVMANMMTGFGMPSVTRDDSGELVLTGDKIRERYFDANEAIWNFMRMDANVLVENFDSDYDLLNSMFRNGQFLFGNWTLKMLVDYRDIADFDVGVLPYPKYDELQESYYAVSPSYQTLSVIQSCAQADTVGTVLETMGAASVDLLTPVAIEKQILVKATRDEESERSINIMFNNKSAVNDLLVDHYWSGVGYWSAYYEMSTSVCLAETFSFASMYESIHDKMLNAITQGFEDYAAMLG